MLCVPPYLIEMSVEWKSRRSMRLEKSFNGFYSDESLQLLENCKYSIKTTFNPRRCLLALFQMLIGLNCRMIAKMLVIYSFACAKKNSKHSNSTCSSGKANKLPLLSVFFR